ncbi:armadillo-type protein [Syncephalis pseudoplumigaleata]|uniref:Armadillo-type protein n=1 Tax=Syncephalis pseudoplumigaleata TaxID=1712513 RepID=A0A4P9Z2R0_9FUNG|nr:armadillo-type protein [Syncephalis pseudoplumigaleata]|eukprot:RKP25760.1 armadillo-type protein [Syncephalis pseudoplumigaleata]
MSEAQQLLQTFSATLHPDPQVRGQAEAQLANLESTPGSIAMVLELIASPEVDGPTRQAASIFFKNSIRRHWAPSSDGQARVVICDQDKETIKNKLLQTIAFTPSNISAQLVTCLSSVIDTEYPERWPQFLPMLQEMLQNSEQHVVHAGLSSLREAVKVYHYGNPALLAGAGAKYHQFAEAFVREIMPNILRTYLGQVDQAIAGHTWISQRCTALCCHLLSDSIKHKATWAILKPHTEALVAQFIFPQLCIRPEDEALWTEDPVDFVNKKSDPLEDMRSPTSASITLLFDLVRDRKKVTFMPILNFLSTTLMRYQQSPPESRNPREKDGALCMMGCLADQMLLKTSPVRAQLEELVMVHIYPEFTSPVAYLRARACETMSKFDHLTFSNPQASSPSPHDSMDHPRMITEATLACLKDAELPVRAAAALSLQPLLQFEHVRPVIVQHLPDIMQEFLSLTNQIDVDAMSSVTDEFVEIFGDELAPYAVQICSQLVSGGICLGSSAVQ